jgi:hypothetical protein
VKQGNDTLSFRSFRPCLSPVPRGLGDSSGFGQASPGTLGKRQQAVLHMKKQATNIRKRETKACNNDLLYIIFIYSAHRSKIKEKKKHAAA